MTVHESPLRDSDPVEEESRLRYVACVSYPRAGHHLTVRILRHYFREQFRYCQYYKADDPECCRTFPCRNDDVTMTKNHDMDLSDPSAAGIPKVTSVPYLILVRNFLEAVVSDYNLYLREHEDSVSNWRRFARGKVDYYRRFVTKWALDQDDLEKLVVNYESLTERPASEFRRVIEFFGPDAPINERRLSRLLEAAALEDVQPERTEVVRNFGVRNRRRIEDFSHYDPVYFGELEGRLADVLQRAGYSLRFHTK